MHRTWFVVALVALAPLARAQTQPQQPAGTPPAQQPAAPPPQQPPAQQPPTPPPDGTAPSSGSSQQVVVNPPAQAAPAQPPPQQPPPSSTTVVTPPPGQTTVVSPDREVAIPERRSPMATVAIDGLYGGIAGLVVGAGIALINEGDDWGRYLMIGAGSGLLVGTVVGGIHAASDARAVREARERAARQRVSAFDGLGSTARDPVVTARPVFAIQGSF